MPVVTGAIVLLNDTIANNAAYFGGGIAYPDEADTIENTIVADNSGGVTSGGGGDCYDSSTTDNAGSADVGGNIDGDSTCFIARLSTTLSELILCSRHSRSMSRQVLRPTP